MTPRRLPRTARVLLAVIAACAAFAIFAYEDGLSARAAVGRPAPAFDLTSSTGRTVALADLRGRPAVLNFWASWCTVCTDEAPVIEAFARRYAGAVRVVGVDWREPQATLVGYVHSEGFTFTNLRDGDGAVAARYGLTGVPETWFVDRRGTATRHVIGAVTFEQLVAASVGAPRVRASGLLWSGSSLWVATSTGLYETTDLGRRWIRRVSGPVAFIVQDGSAWVAAGPTGPWRLSTDRGRSWRTAQGPPGRPAAVSAEAPALWAWTSTGLWRSPGGGGLGGWTRLAPATALPAAPDALAAVGTRLYAATGDGVFVSTDAGRTWRPVALVQPVTAGGELASPAAVVTGTQPLQAEAIAPWRAAVYFAGSTGIWRLGAPAGGRLTASPPRAFAGLAPGPGGSLWAIAPDGDLYEASADGAAWTWRRYAGAWVG